MTAAVSALVQRYINFSITKGLQREFKEFEAIWPMIKMVRVARHYEKKMCMNFVRIDSRVLPGNGSGHEESTL